VYAELISLYTGGATIGGDPLHPLRSILNKIFWDKREKPEDYMLSYIHRGGTGDLRTIPLTKIRTVGKSSFTYKDEKGDETMIPFHRVTAVRHVVSGKVLWQKRKAAR
jgi:uncharacterized protein (UPF0248 family)